MIVMAVVMMPMIVTVMPMTMIVTERRTTWMLMRQIGKVTKTVETGDSKPNKT